MVAIYIYNSRLPLMPRRGAPGSILRFINLTLPPVVAHNPGVELDPVTSADTRKPDCSDLLLPVHHHLDKYRALIGFDSSHYWLVIQCWAA